LLLASICGAVYLVQSVSDVGIMVMMTMTTSQDVDCFIHLTGTLKLQSNGPLYSNTVIGTMAADGWAVTFGTVWVGWGPAQFSPRCTKCNSSIEERGEQDRK